VIAGNAGNPILQLSAFAAHFGNARGECDGRPRAAFLQGIGGTRARYSEQREIYSARQFVDLGDPVQAGHLLPGAADEVDIAAVFETLQILQRGATCRARLFGTAYDCNRPGLQERSYCCHRDAVFRGAKFTNPAGAMAGKPL